MWSLLGLALLLSAALPARAQWTTSPVTAPRVQYRTFQSAAAGATVSFHIYTPPEYDSQLLRRFPVLYWLHGSESATAGIPTASNWFASAMSRGDLPPMLVVFPNGMPNGMYCDAADGSRPMETVIMQELLPHVDATFRTFSHRRGRIVEGFSMGGYGAGRFGFKYSGRFVAASMLGAGPVQLDFMNPPPGTNVPPSARAAIFEDVWSSDPALFFEASPWNLATVNAGTILASRLRMRMAVGESDAMLVPNADLHAHLVTLGIPHSWQTFPGIDHNPLALLQALGPTNWDFYRGALSDNCAAADFNESGGVTVQDIFDFLAGWNSQSTGGPIMIASADFNGQDGITVQDIFDFLEAWIAGCP
jgi:enterochelin esterase-like enzyme